MQIFYFKKFSKYLLFVIIINSIPRNVAEEEVAVTTSQTQRKPPPIVKLNKCCHYGEYLDVTQNACVAGSSEHWVPLIFLINRRTYYAPQGYSPKFMIFEENVKPLINSTTDAEVANNSTSHGCYAYDELELLTSGKGNLLLFSNGSLFLQERSQLIAPQHFCVDRDSALVCFPKPAKQLPPRVKLLKCCGKHSSYDAVAKTCTFAPTSPAELKLPLNESLFHVTYGFPKCHDNSNSFAISDWKEVKLQEPNGQLQLPHKNLTAADYCLEHLRDGSVTVIKILACLHHFAGANDILANSIAGETNSNRLQVVAISFGLIISVVFLLATLIAGYLMPSVHHVLHWRCQIYYVFCLLIGDSLLAYTQLPNSLEQHSAMCMLIASTMHFFFLSAFFWLNTMCFNIWWTFRDFRPSSLERNQELLRLRLYSAYAWGIPLLISVIAAFVDQLPDTQLLRPNFGQHCWFSGDHLTIFAYFFGPVGILLCANIVLFVSTTHQLTCGLWKRDDVKSTTEKTALGKVCLKLVVVMGVTWIADIISWIVGGPHSAWLFTDLVNALQGVFIFIVVGCQPQVWAACKRICCPRSRQEITNTTNGVQHSSSSQGLPSLAACGAEITQNTSVVNTTIAANTSQAKIPMETMC